jgi:hypothetical protein
MPRKAPGKPVGEPYHLIGQLVVIIPMSITMTIERFSLVRIRHIECLLAPIVRRRLRGE